MKSLTEFIASNDYLRFVQSPRILSVIPARGGSKRLPRKNLLPLHGLPLLAWSILASRKSECITEHLVSTDDDEIAEIALRYQALLHRRPAILAQDTSPTLPVLKDAVLSRADRPDFVVLLQPTSPFRSPQTIDRGIKMLIESGHDALIAVTRSRFGPEWLLKTEQGLLLPPDQSALAHARSQDMQTRFYINGALYVFRTDVLMEAKDYAFGNKTLPLELPSPEDFDIDTPEDFRIAEAIAHEFSFDWK